MNVLLGMDAGDLGFRALEETLSRAREAGDDLTVAIYGDENGRAEATARVEERLSAAGLEAALRHVEGDPGSQLVELADSSGFDRLVVAGGERTPLGKIRLGSVAEFVLLNAETTVTVVR